MTELKTPVRLLTHSKTVDRRDLNVTDSRSSVRPFAKRAAAYVTVARCTIRAKTHGLLEIRAPSNTNRRRRSDSRKTRDSAAGPAAVLREERPSKPEAASCSGSLRF